MLQRLDSRKRSSRRAISVGSFYAASNNYGQVDSFPETTNKSMQNGSPPGGVVASSIACVFCFPFLKSQQTAGVTLPNPVVYDLFLYIWIVQIVTVGDETLSQTSHANYGRSYVVTSFERQLESVLVDDHPLVDLRHVLRQQTLDNRQLTASICYSSGTTGRPKGCMATHHGYIGNGCAIRWLSD